MADAFYIKRGDTSPKLIYTLSPLVNLTGASVVFNMRKTGQANIVNRGVAAIVAPASAGVVSYAWTAPDTALAGTFIGEFEVTYADGTIETYPNSGYLNVMISDDLG